ncbi:TIGR03747 family integrating conjugative element membrane protein [Salmonella enterica subsp. enterica]|nr:TIGR03747 family integrating conjugative element membrane protein [Salmonella enterica subsp. enterica]MIF51111.1 TIGR03747 family integrating conjugative element membrane protein [Salmonella enterica subsp. enterica]
MATPLSWLGHITITLLGSLLFSLVVEWAGIAFFWPEAGAEHAHIMMRQELRWFSDEMTRSLLMDNPVGKLEQVLLLAWQKAFIDTGFMPWIESLRHNPGSYWIDTYLKASVYIVLTFILRVFVLLLTIPLFILVTLVGIVDGLVRRDIRRFGCGYESGFIYHHAKRANMPVFFLAWIIYLSLPFSVNSCLILLPAALLFGFLVSITVGSFKKYL